MPDVADGFAELLSMGVYGELSTTQQSSIDRMRRSIRSALARLLRLIVHGCPTTVPAGDPRREKG